MKILSIDVENTSLWGEAFAIGAVVRQDGIETARFAARVAAPVCDWVRDNVLPALDAPAPAGLPVTHEDRMAMLFDFADFYLSHKGGAEVIVHMGVPVEARLFADLREADMIGEFDGPYPLLDVAGVLRARGFDPSTVDGYNRDHGLVVPGEMSPHHPVYDAIAAAIAYEYLLR